MTRCTPVSWPGFVGIALVALYMILYYRALGVVVVLGLSVWAALNYCIIVWLSGNAGLALSLAGVTGIVVSVGVTTDSYIVYFERMKDEVKTGKTVRAAVDYGFKRAWHTIVAADGASFIGAHPAVLVDRGRGARLRLLPRLVGVARPVHRLLLQASDGGLADAQSLAHRRTVDRRAGRARHGAATEGDADERAGGGWTMSECSENMATVRPPGGRTPWVRGRAPVER